MPPSRTLDRFWVDFRSILHETTRLCSRIAPFYSRHHACAAEFVRRSNILRRIWCCLFRCISFLYRFGADVVRRSSWKEKVVRMIITMIPHEKKTLYDGHNTHDHPYADRCTKCATPVFRAACSIRRRTLAVRLSRVKLNAVRGPLSDQCQRS